MARKRDSHSPRFRGLVIARIAPLGCLISANVGPFLRHLAKARRHFASCGGMQAKCTKFALSLGAACNSGRFPHPRNAALQRSRWISGDISGSSWNMREPCQTPSTFSRVILIMPLAFKAGVTKASCSRDREWIAITCGNITTWRCAHRDFNFRNMRRLRRFLERNLSKWVSASSNMLPFWKLKRFLSHFQLDLVGSNMRNFFWLWNLLLDFQVMTKNAQTPFLTSNIPRQSFSDKWNARGSKLSGMK